LAQIVAWIRAEPRSDVQEWLTISLSRIVNRVSRQESETRYVAVDKNALRGETMRRFTDSCATTAAMLKVREPVNADVHIEYADVRTHLPLGDVTIDRIITSPPYANSMDYYLYHKQRMNILGYNFKAVQNTEIGSRHEFSSLKASAEKWKRDYAAVLSEFRRVLRPGGSAIVIIGDSQIAGEKIDAAHLTEKIAASIGFRFEVLGSVPLEGRSRSFSRGFQRPNKMEHTVRLLAPSRARSRRVDLPEIITGDDGGVLRVTR
jgi:site-specific DNA-methyltransferase (cytosine-N4-specific)